MTDQLSPDMAEALGLPEEPAVIGGMGAALSRLLPALDGYVDGHHAQRFPAYMPGTVPSQQLDLPDEGVGLPATIDEIAIAVEHGCRISAPGFVGYITTGASTAGVVASTAIATAGGQRYLLHAFNALEWTGLRWLAQLCGLPSDVHGVFSSGGSTAQLLALGAARQSTFERAGFDVAADGLPAGVQTRIYVSTRGHRTIHRSAAVLGLGRNAVAEIPELPTGHIDLAALAETVRADAARGVLPLAVVAIAGSTDTGSIDRIDDIVEIARRHRAWVHVDGAYGLVANAVPSLAGLFAGVNEADSWIVDPHKWLVTGVGVGATYVRDREVLNRAFAEGDSAYIPSAFFQDPAAAESQFDMSGGRWADEGVELSAPPRGALVWAALREIGRQGVIDRIERHIGFARAVADRVGAEDCLELLCDAQLSIVCFRYRPPEGVDGDALNERIIERLRRETPFIPTSTIVMDTLAIRPCFINPRTTPHEVGGLVDEVIRLGDELVATG